MNSSSPTEPHLDDQPVPESAPSELDVQRERRRSMRLRWMTGLLCAVVVVLSMVMSTSHGTRVHLPGIKAPLPELCTTKVIFGQPCPGCGMTRAFISIGHGQLQEAWAYNPAAFLMFPLVVFQIPWQAIQWWRLRRGLPELPAVGILPYGIVLLLLLIGQWIVSLLN